MKESSKTLEAVERENALLKDSITEIGNSTIDNKMFEREIDFLNEQLDDADYYIQNMVGLLEERSQNLEKESSRRGDLEEKFAKISKEIQGSAFFFGSTSIDMPVFERTYKNREKTKTGNAPYDSPGYGKIAEIVAKKFNIKGPCYTVTTACTSSANCLLYAA